MGFPYAPAPHMQRLPQDHMPRQSSALIVIDQPPLTQRHHPKPVNVHAFILGAVPNTHVTCVFLCSIYSSHPRLQPSNH